MERTEACGGEAELPSQPVLFGRAIVAGRPWKEGMLEEHSSERDVEKRVEWTKGNKALETSEDEEREAKA